MKISPIFSLTAGLQVALRWLFWEIDWDTLQSCYDAVLGWRLQNQNPPYNFPHFQNYENTGYDMENRIYITRDKLCQTSTWFD